MKEVVENVREHVREDNYEDMCNDIIQRLKNEMGMTNELEPSFLKSHGLVFGGRRSSI